MQKIGCTKEFYVDGKYLSTMKLNGLKAMQELAKIALERSNNKREVKIYKRYNKKEQIEIVASWKISQYNKKYEYVFYGELIKDLEYYV